MTRIVVVGGGAGGLELVTKLGNKLGRRGKAHITLIDRDTTHLWKPLLHEIAVGTMNEGLDEVSYRAHARAHGFTFRVGGMTNVDREARQVVLAPLYDDEGEQVLPVTRVDYDILVIALGAISNDFNTPGVRQYCTLLDSPKQAHRFRDKLFQQFLRIQRLPESRRDIRIAIVGGGATGVELSAEIHHAVEEVHSYGFDVLDSSCLKITLIEAGPRILAALPERISLAATHELKTLGVDVRVNTAVSEAVKGGFKTQDGELLEADLMVWAAGVKVADFMKDLAGLETNRINQLVVNEYLQTTRDPAIFAVGDCAAFTMPDGSRVPPRAQSAHQMADTCYRNILASIKGKAMKPYRYRDHGSLVSLARYSTVGSLMGNLTSGSLFIEGRIARTVYISLYRLHQVAVHGFWKTGMLMFAGRVNRWLRPRLKLH